MGLHLVPCPAVSCCSFLNVTSPSLSRPGPEVHSLFTIISRLCVYIQYFYHTDTVRYNMLMWCFLTVILSYSVPGWSSRSRPGVFPFLCLSVHTFQNSWGCAGNTLLAGLVNIHLHYMFRHTAHVAKYVLVQQKFSYSTRMLLLWLIFWKTRTQMDWHINANICGRSYFNSLVLHDFMLVCRITVTVWDTFTCPDGKVGEY